MIRIVPLWLGVFTTACTCLAGAVACHAKDYQDRFWATRSNAGRCEIAQDGAQFMRRFAMFDAADHLERLGEVSCLADFRGDPVLMPEHRPKASQACSWPILL